MKLLRRIYPAAAGAAFALALLAGGAPAQEMPAGTVLLAQGGADCYAIGQRVAAQQGGTLAGARAENRGGQTVCRIVVLLPAKNGERPRRVERTVPAR